LSVLSEKQRTVYFWTKGIYNLPLSDRRSRYFFFELDSWDRKAFNLVRNTYLESGLCVYWHTTTNGYHFFNFKVLSQQRHTELVKLVKHLNPEYPPTTLRILANKWEQELELWKNGNIECPSYTDNPLDEFGNQFTELSRFKDWLEHKNISIIQTFYKVESYKFEECPKCKEKDRLYCRKSDNKFICKNCGIEAVHRGGR
jgi:predicted RNA-binding Zn-ribbon protein involved in translation (DUF1610 family)